MKLLLRDDVDGVGNKGDIVEVANGYGRNYLVPRGLAMPAAAGAEVQAEGMRRSRDTRHAEERGAAEEIATRVVGRPVSIAHRASDDGKLFGSVTASEVSDALGVQLEVEIDRKKLDIAEPIKALGTYTVMAKLHADVQFPVTVEVIEES